MKKSKFRDTAKSLRQKNSSNNIQDRPDMVKEKNISNTKQGSKTKLESIKRNTSKLL